MRPKAFPIWLLWVIIFGINGEVTLESVYQKVNDLEFEMKSLKVFFYIFIDQIQVVRPKILYSERKCLWGPCK